ncbi:hypothetical protein MMA15_18245 [Streptomyces sp. M600PL45_2]|uniref:Uncharacterized protein n=1 Tax=Streptomyces marispadix TaxID=2922868 RepID=A0ABS9T148_9ACTN|nr:hypothetical protein [Streptomyces marispadix]MCH6162254.1 hypothetical protein [Streptomyces marispadix]
MSAHRRSLMTATAAGAVLCALWFVPSAKATPEAPGQGRTSAQELGQGQGSGRGAESVPGTDLGSGAASETDWADGRAHASSAAADAGEDGLTSPFVLSSLGLAGTGAVLIVRARRRASYGPRV